MTSFKSTVHYALMFTLLFVRIFDVTGAADHYEPQGPSSIYMRKPPSKMQSSSLNHRDDIPRILKIYHYDNSTDCESACLVPCGVTFVIRNDVEERRQYTCTLRKTPTVAAFIDISNSGILMLVLSGSLMLCGLLVITCCCCMRCCANCRCFGANGGCCCCRTGCCASDNVSNDPLVNGGEFRETLDSKDIGYLKKERTIVTV